MPENIDCECGLSYQITDEQIEKIVDLTIKKMTDRFYINVGRTVMDKFFFVVGVAALALTAYLNSKGLMTK